MIKVNLFFFVSLLRSLRHDQKKNNNLVTTFTTSWLRVLSLFFWFRHCVHYAMIKRKTFYFSFGHYVQYAMITEKKRFYFITTLTTLQLWKKWVFLFYWDVHYGNIFLHDLTSTYCTQYVTNLSKKFPNNILPVKNMCNLKNFLHWSLTYLLPKFWLLCHLINCTCTYFENRKLPWDEKGEGK